MDQPAAPRAQSSPCVLDRVFDLGNSGSNVRTELLAGLTTFLTMVYIVFVNPQILGNAGMDKGAVFVATCIAAAVSTAVMALYANYPIALAPGHGTQRVLRLHRRADDEIHLAAGARRGVLLRGDLLPDLDLPDPRIHHQFDTAEFKLAISAGVGLFLGIIAPSATRNEVVSGPLLVRRTRYLPLASIGNTRVASLLSPAPAVM